MCYGATSCDMLNAYDGGPWLYAAFARGRADLGRVVKPGFLFPCSFL